MRIIAIAATALLLASCQTSTFEGVAFGEPLTLDEVTPLSTLLAEPAGYVGERVLVEGTVADVCDKAGCWMDLVGETPDEKIQVKVDDGVIVFPQTATGNRARVEGVVEQLDYTEEEAIAAARHRAEENGESFDPASIDGPQTLFRIRGAGAVIAGISADEVETAETAGTGHAEEAAPAEEVAPADHGADAAPADAAAADAASAEEAPEADAQH